MTQAEKHWCFPKVKQEWNHMDELVAVGAAGLVGLVLTVLLLLGGICWIALLIWSAYITGQWQGIAEIFGILLILIAGYAAIGIWLQKSGRI